ncbi:MAG: L-serine ammonia-lyase, iron-sulfur-dependent subunit beta [Oscillospiraceae bacterium]
MKYNSVFEIIGPIMVGPSSSHTAGAARLGRMARYLAGGDIKSVDFLLHGSFAQTYQGHGTDKALLAGIMDIDSSDYRLRDAFSIADSIGLHYSFAPADLGDVHPNTVKCVITTKDGETVSVTGSSIGGGSVVITCIDDINVYFTGENPILVTKHKDTPGVVSNITYLLYKSLINIGNMRVNRIENTDTAAMYIELDGKIDKSLLPSIREIDGIDRAILLEA